MALQLFKNSLRPLEVGRAVSCFSTSRTCQKDEKLPKPQVENLSRLESKHQAGGYRNVLITVRGPNDVSKISGIPVEIFKGRRVRIYKFTKNAMQSGTHNVGVWQLDFDTQPRWENPLMGWASTGDPVSNMRVEFENKEEAIEFANKNGWEWYLDEGTPVKPKTKSYGFNFSWNKRTRVSTK